MCCYNRKNNHLFVLGLDDIFIRFLLVSPGYHTPRTRRVDVPCPLTPHRLVPPHVSEDVPETPDDRGPEDRPDPDVDSGP